MGEAFQSRCKAMEVPEVEALVVRAVPTVEGAGEGRKGIGDDKGSHALPPSSGPTKGATQPSGRMR